MEGGSVTHMDRWRDRQNMGEMFIAKKKGRKKVIVLILRHAQCSVVGVYQIVNQMTISPITISLSNLGIIYRSGTMCHCCRIFLSCMTCSEKKKSPGINPEPFHCRNNRKRTWPMRPVRDKPTRPRGAGHNPSWSGGIRWYFDIVSYLTWIVARERGFC